MSRKISLLLVCVMLVASCCSAVSAQVPTDINVAYSAETGSVTVSGTAHGKTVITITPEELLPGQMSAGMLPAVMDQIYSGGMLSYTVTMPDGAATGKYLVYVTADGGEDIKSFILIDADEASDIISSLIASQKKNDKGEFTSAVTSNAAELGIDTEDALYIRHGSKITDMLYKSDFSSIYDFTALYNKYLAICVINGAEPGSLGSELIKYGADLSISYAADIEGDKRLTPEIKSELYSLLVDYDYSSEIADGNINFPVILSNTKALAAIRCADTWSEIKDIILTDFADELDGITDDTDYDDIDDQNSVFKNMIKKAPFDSYEDIFDSFALAAEEAYEDENGSSSSSSSGGRGGSGGGGGSSFSAPAAAAPDTLDSTGSSYTFRDLREDHWAYDAVYELSGRGIISGFPDGEFKGDRNITRAEFTKLVMGFVNKDNAEEAAVGPVFADVSDSDWYRDVVYEAAKYSIVLGSEGNFNPDALIKREDAAVIIHRIMKINGNAPLATKYFADRDSISDYASEAVESLGSLDIVKGRGNNEFVPAGYITRYEAAQLISNAFLKGDN